MNLAKSLIVSKKLFFSSEKTFSIIAHLCSEMAVFGRKSDQILPTGKAC
jgi:hypothetical protein